ncbi:MAG: LysM peptidoglycan-binding domain-containing protein, partial [Candidatus Saccharibacteria bacterium]|nr:LysM peptidoglycan-binding domain-containing protein [Candidatus Saccharibacteria bacterium]
MKKNKISSFIEATWVYALIAVVILSVAIFGSREKNLGEKNDLDMNRIVENNSYVTVDQLSEFYTTATVAEAIDMSTATVIRNNYESVSVMQDSGQTDAAKVVKPSIIDVSHLARGVVSYTVEEGDTVAKLVQEYQGVTEQDIRWSNNIKADKEPEAGKTILIPTSHGIAYTTKDGDTVDSLAEKYKSNAEQTVILNDLETSDKLQTGTVLLLPGGELPEKERPDYVEPTPARTYYGYSSSGSSGSSYSSYSAAYSSGNRYAYGWCTWYAWQWRRDNMPGNYNLPSNMGNANRWASAAAAAGFTVNRTPMYGAVFQTGAGWYGHVGVVTAVNGDGT